MCAYEPPIVDELGVLVDCPSGLIMRVEIVLEAAEIPLTHPGTASGLFPAVAVLTIITVLVTVATAAVVAPVILVIGGHHRGSPEEPSEGKHGTERLLRE